MLTTTEKTVREIAIENPSSIRVFESLGIDYCCGGKRSLSEACSKAAVDMDHVLDLLEEADRDSHREESGDWNSRPLSELIDYIVNTHHAFVRRETPRIESFLSKVVSKHGSSHPEVIQIERLFIAVGQELSTHMIKEEQMLFPFIQRMETAVQSGNPTPPAFFGSVKRPIANMVAEHDDAGALLAQIRQLSNAFTPPPGACLSFVALYRGLADFEEDLHHHVHLENNILFPRAIEMEATH